MARGTIVDYFARLPRHSQNQGPVSSSSTSNAVNNSHMSPSPILSSSSPTKHSQNLTLTENGDETEPPKKKLKITASNACKVGSSSIKLNRETTEVNVIDAPRKQASFVRSAHSRSKLRMFPSFPVDIILEIFSHLLPNDLIHLMRTTKDLRNLILHRSATFVWKSAFANVNAEAACEDDDEEGYDEYGEVIDLPPCPKNMVLPQWASLIWDTFCQNCLAYNVRNVNFYLRVRYCNKCAKIELFPASKLKPNDDKDHDLVMKCVPFSIWTDQRCCTVADKDAFLQQLQDIRLDGQMAPPKNQEQQNRSELQTSKVESFIKEKERECSLRSEHARKCDVWLNRIFEKREDELDSAMTRRVNEIRKRLREKGYQSEVDFLDNLDRGICAVMPLPQIHTFGFGHNKHPQLKVRKELTEKGWSRLEPLLVAWMLEARALSVKNERAIQVQKREALFHRAYLNWRNDTKNLEKYPSWMLMPRFADILGVGLGGVGDEDESGWDPNDSFADDPTLLAKGLRTIREIVEFGYDRKAEWEKEEEEKHGATWLLFHVEQAARERMQKKSELKKREEEEERTGVMKSTHPEVTLDAATEIITKQVPKFVDMWRREKIKSLWERAYTRRDLSKFEFDVSYGRRSSDKPDSRIRFPWWDDEAATRRPFKEKNSYKSHRADEREELRLKDLQLAVVVFRCEEDNGGLRCHWTYDKKRCTDDDVCDPDAPTGDPWGWLTQMDNKEPCLWYPHFLFHPCTSMKAYSHYEERSGTHASLSMSREYEKTRSAAWEGIEEDEKARMERRKEYVAQSTSKVLGYSCTEPRRLKFDEKASKAVRNLIEAAGLDEQEITTVQMDEFKLQFVCLKCTYGRNCDGERRVRVWAWREAVQHALKFHFGDAHLAWECLSPSETAKALVLQETQALKKQYLLEDEQKTWKCLKCRDSTNDKGRMTLLQMYKHWRKFPEHGDRDAISDTELRSNRPDRPQAPEHILGYYRALDYSPRELPAVNMVVLPLTKEELKAREMVKKEMQERKMRKARAKERAGFPLLRRDMLMDSEDDEEEETKTRE